MDYHTARHIAERVVAQLTPYCDKIKICGSIRRRKSEVSDIDIVCLPKTEPIKDMFGMISGHKRPDGFIQAINSMQKIKGDPEGKYTQRMLEGMKVEIAMASPSNWGNLCLIRTGDADFSKIIMTIVLKRGLQQKEGHLYKNDELMPVFSELDYFKILRIPYIEPELRNKYAYKDIRL